MKLHRDVPAPNGLGYVQICPHCDKEIPAQTRQQGGLHMGCCETKIDVWFVSMLDAPKQGYYENDVSKVAEMLKTSEDPYLIERQEMKAGLFYNIPEFQGF